MMQKIGMEKNKREFRSTKYYVNAIKRETVRTDHPQQRESGQWTNEYRDGLIGTVLKNEDIPYVVICEQVTETGVDNYLIDGIQRVTTIFNYRVGAFKLGNKVENPLIDYQINVLDENGVPMRDENGHLVHKTVTCDIRGKGYKDLPEELQEMFDEYQLAEVKHLNCSDDQIGYHLRRYNHAKKMGASQNGITYLDKKIAMQVKNITTSHTFFKDLGKFKPAERNNDTLNRVVLESIMATYFINDWKSSLKDICTYLNDHIEDNMITTFEDELNSISEVMTDTVADMFNSKNSFLWFVTYHKFCETGVDPKSFIEFMEEFKTTLHNKKWNNTTFDEMNQVSTKKKSFIIEKLHLLEDFLYDFLHIDDNDLEKVDVLAFVKENINIDVTQEDIDFYGDIFKDLALKVNRHSKLLDKCNKPSWIAFIGYACEHDINLDRWFVNYIKNHNEYIRDQRENLQSMIKDLENDINKMKLV